MDCIWPIDEVNVIGGGDFVGATCLKWLGGAGLNWLAWVDFVEAIKPLSSTVKRSSSITASYFLFTLASLIWKFEKQHTALHPVHPVQLLEVLGRWKSWPDLVSIWIQRLKSRRSTPLRHHDLLWMAFLLSAAYFIQMRPDLLVF